MKLKPLAIAAMLAAGTVLTAPAHAETDTSRNDILFTLADRNNDGAIDPSEIIVLRAALFDAMDLDHDGHLTRSEAMIVAERMRARVGDRLAAVVKAGPGGLLRKREMAAARLGLDKPGGVSRDDFIGRNSQVLAQADADANGTISRAEFDAVARFVGAALTPD